MIFKFYFRKRRIKRARRNKTNQKLFLEHKERARTFVTSRLEFYNQHYGLKFNRIFIKNHIARWGSCSSKKNLNFNYRIVLLPPELANYIIVHELCHLGQFNHSQKFWDLVGETIPNYLKLRSKLSKIRCR